MGQDYQVVAEQVGAGALYNGVTQASISVATAISTTIPVNSRVIRVSATAATTSASCTLGTPNPALDGFQVTLVNKSANNIVISGGMKGAAAATVSGSQAAIFTWIATSTAWFVTKG